MNTKTILLLISFIFLVLCQEITTDVTVCAGDLKLCADGSSVGRDTNNNCEFALCPGEQTDSSITQDDTMPTEGGSTGDDTMPTEGGSTGDETATDTNLPTEIPDDGLCIEGYRTYFIDSMESSDLDIFKNLFFSNMTTEETGLRFDFMSSVDKYPFSVTINESFKNDFDECKVVFNFSSESFGLKEYTIPGFTPDYNFTETFDNLNSLFTEGSYLIVSTDCNVTVLSFSITIKFEDQLCVSTTTEETVVPTDHKTCEFSGCDDENVSTQSDMESDQLNSDCVYGTLRFGGYCACWSGAFGKNCTFGEAALCQKIIINAWKQEGQLAGYTADLDTQDERDFCMNVQSHETCTSQWGEVLPLNTLNPPTMDSAIFEDNNLNIMISQPMVNGRADGAVFLNDNNLNKTNPYCTYPISEYIFKQVDGCRDIWNFSIPWDQAIQCGWRMENEEGFRTYKGQVIVHNHEWIEILKEFRFIQSVLRIKIRFQLFVNISLETVVYNQPNLRAAITKQIVAININDTASIQLTTVLNQPYKLTNGDLVLTPTDKVESHLTSSSDEQCGGEVECRQRWDSELSLTEGTCTLDGDYRMNFTKTCSDSSSDCPLLESEKTTTIDFTLKSENFCAEISVEIGLYGSIKVYDDAAFTTIRNVFVIGKIAYFLIELNSDSNPSPYLDSTASIKFSSTKLRTVTVRVNDNILRIFELGAPSSDDYGSSIVEIDRSEGNMVGFSFTFSNKLVQQFNSTSKMQVTIGAEVDVSYANSKRSVFADNNGQEKTSFSTTKELDTENNNDKNFGNIIFASLALVLFAVLIN